MKKIFKEYHQFAEQEFQQLWKDCLFVFDTNTLLNMYRYSRATVDTYFDVLKELKNKNQLWIPYQVGYEFYENRINVISEYEKSYDEILSILKKTKSDIEDKYKDHPFLDLGKIKEEMSKGLSGVEIIIEQAKKNHPKWLEKDEVLEKLNQLFEGNIGNNYDEQKLKEIKKEGKERYEKKVPPGFKDDDKPEDIKYGDLILWYQIIDKAKESKKPIVLISGDVKEDWWLKKDGKRLMPLPQLKKEISDKAGVDFHIYTADRFLEYYKTGKKEIDNRTIEEVRKIRKSEEKRMMMRRMEMMERERELDPRMLERYSIENIHPFEILEDLMMKINESEIHSRHKEELDHLFRKIRELRNRIVHGEIDRMSFDRFFRYTKEILFILNKIIRSGEIHSELSIRFREYIDRLEHLNQRFIRYM
jgi:hypothetical protein